MPAPVPGAELRATASRSTTGHRRLRDDEIEDDDDNDVFLARQSNVLEAHPELGDVEKGMVLDSPAMSTKESADVDASHLPTAQRAKELEYASATHTTTGRNSVSRWFWSMMAILIKYGVEERGIQPVPEDERAELKWHTVLPQATLWAAANTNILTFSAGTLGPILFGLDLTTSVWVILVMNFVSAMPVALFATFGPVLGMRAMVQTRYVFGYYLALLPALCNCATMICFTSLNAILGGQTLSLASGSTISNTVGIIIVAVISLALSFLGLRALHLYSMGSFVVILVLYFVLVGLTGDKLHLAQEVSKEITVSAGQILGYAATVIGFTLPYASLASDFTTYLPAQASRKTLFLMVFFGLFAPISALMIFGAACQLTAQAYTNWTEAAEVGVADMLFAMCGSGGAAKFVMVLFMFSVTANTAPSIYSCGLSGIVVFPFLVRIPRYFLAIVVSCIYVPIAIVAASNFYSALSNFTAVFSYWVAIYVPPTMIEALVIRRPISRITFPLAIWNDPKRLPIGYAAMLAIACGVPVIVAGMAQTWWVGWIARRIPVGGGDVGFELGVAVTAIVYLPARLLERRYTGR